MRATLLSRRRLLWGSGLAGLLAAGEALPRVAGVVPRGAPDLTAPATNATALVRMMGSLKEEDVPWWFNGTIYGIVGEEAPRAVLAFEGMELYWIRHLQAGAYELIGHTVTFFRDPASGEMLHSFENPYTRRTNAVPAAVQGGSAGQGFTISPQGFGPTRFLDRMPEKPLRLDWSFARDVVWLHNETPYPPGMPPPRAQRQTLFAPVAALNDPKVASLPTVFSSTVFQPWFKWMDMGERPGHMVWHAGGAKLRSIDELPREFRRRLEREFPERLTARPGPGGRQ